MALPRGVYAHLCRLPIQWSAPSAAMSSWSWPGAWAASTSTGAPAAVAAAAAAATGTTVAVGEVIRSMTTSRGAARAGGGVRRRDRVVVGADGMGRLDDPRPGARRVMAERHADRAVPV